MSLRGKKPEERQPRLKALLYGPAGVGKTTAAIQMPKPYIIDCEDGSGHYGDIIESRGGAVFQTTSLDDAIQEVRTLATVKHDFLTLVVDPFTALYDTELDAGEKAVGSDFGRHYGYANKSSKRLYHLISALDMNVVFTCHSKNEYGDSMKVIGQTFDGWKKLDYMFDLAFFLERDVSGKRVATVRKTRLKEFEDQSRFEWSYGALAERYGAEKLERKPDVLVLADKSQVEEFEGLLSKLSEAEQKRLRIDKVLKEFDDLADMPKARIERGIEHIKEYLNQPTAKAV